jgi:quercetin dioxygenase-like cupin family protein
MKDAKPIIRDEDEGERRWFYGGGLNVWKATADETNGSLFVLEDHLARGKVTPLHQHPDMDEVAYVIEGEILYMGGGVERRVGRGATIVTPRGVSHAFMVVSESARLLFLQTPGAGEAFYRRASEPADAAEGPVDFARIREAAMSTGATVVLGPPPFSKP